MSVISVFDTTSTSLTIGNGTFLEVSAGGITEATTLDNGGFEIISSGGVASFTTISNGGRLIVSNGGSAISTTIDFAGTEIISSGGIAEDTTLAQYGALEVVRAGGSAISTTISTGEQLVSAGGTAEYATVSGGGTQEVFSGGLAISTTVLSNGFENVSAGGSTVHTDLTGGGTEIVYSGGVAEYTSVTQGSNEYISGGGEAISTSVEAGYEWIYTGGLAEDTILNANGYEFVLFGASADATSIQNGGRDYVNGVETEAEIGSGGSQTVDNGGSAIGTTVDSGGCEIVSSGGVISDTVLHEGGTVDLTYVAYAGGGSISFDSGSDQLTISEGGTSVTLQLAGNYAGETFHLSSDGNGGTDVTVSETVACYGSGTRILTDRGEVAVEELRVGDMLVTFAGNGAPLKPIIWVGRARFDAERHPRPSEVWPVRVRAGAFGEAMPRRDLLVSPWHCFLIDGALIDAQRLVNGSTILQDRRVSRGEYFHVEVEGHDILLGEGVLTETYLDCGNRDAFENAGGFTRLHPDFKPKSWKDTCRPMVFGGPVLEAVRARIAARAAELQADPGSQQQRAG
jgi:autotransporter passenger strand-loop-strand repeat protein